MNPSMDFSFGFSRPLLRPFVRSCLPILACLLCLPQRVQANGNSDTTTLQPLAEDEKRAFQQITPDPEPEQLTRNSHYIVSDENRHDTFAPIIAEMGGVYIGVGTNQNYELVGWAKPEIVILLDFDAFIVDLHKIYRLVFLTADTPEAFRKHWAKSSRKKIEALIRSTYKDPAAQKRIMRVFHRSQRPVFAALRRTARRDKKTGTVSFATSQEQYSYVQMLFRQERVFAIRGDLTADKTIMEIAAVMKKFGRTLKLFYISNCEQYFTFNDNFRNNMQALPTVDSSLALRTRPWREFLPDTRNPQGPIRYTFIYQTFENFRIWLSNPKIRKLHDMLPRYRVIEPAVAYTGKPGRASTKK